MSKILSHKRTWIRSIVVACLFVLLAPLSASAGPYGGGESSTYSRMGNGVSWDQGFWLGVHGGIGWGWSQFNEPFPAIGSNRYNINGGTFGVSGTYLMSYWDTGLHGGVRVEMDWANISGTASQNCLGCQTKVTSLGRAVYMVGYGYPMGSYTCYPYVDGGVAFGKAQANVPGFPGVRATQAGWTLGGGVELMFHKNWAITLDYKYAKFNSLHGGADTFGSIVDIPLNVQSLSLGVSYKFTSR